jgi:hypothetical protein
MSLCVDIHIDLMFVILWLWVNLLGGFNTGKKIIHYLDMAWLGSQRLSFGFLWTPYGCLEALDTLDLHDHLLL